VRADHIATLSAAAFVQLAAALAFLAYRRLIGGD
jgi:hypothetical protein